MMGIGQSLDHTAERLSTSATVMKWSFRFRSIRFLPGAIFHDIEPMIELLTRLDITWWNVFFYVPADHEHTEETLTAEENEEAFAKLYAASRRVHFQIKTTEGQHYQRYVVQQRVRESRGKMNADDVIAAAPKGVNDSNGFVFVNHQGDVYPSRYLPLAAGNLTNQSLSEVYCDSPLFASLRD